MGAQVEFNSVLALRENGTIGLLSTECIPTQPQLGIQYSFKKQGHRVYRLAKSLPLLTTKGNGDFSFLVGFVEVLGYMVSTDEEGNICTTGNYRFVSLASQSESSFYLGLGREPSNV